MTISIAQAQLFFLALTRILAMIIHVPVLGGQSVPNQVKIGLGIILGAILIPWQPLPPEAAATPFLPFTFEILREIVIGTLAGLGAAMTFSALQIAGELMGIGSGFSSSRVLNPALGETGSPIDQLFIMTGMLLFLVLNGHHIFLLALGRSFTILPVNSPLPTLGLDRLLAMSAEMIAVGVQMALPVMGALLLADLALGLLARVAPQVQVFFLGLPLKVGLGLLVLSVSFNVLYPVLANWFTRVGERMLHLMGA